LYSAYKSKESLGASGPLLRIVCFKMNLSVSFKARLHYTDMAGSRSIASRRNATPWRFAHAQYIDRKSKSA